MKNRKGKIRTLPSASNQSTTPVDLFLLAGLPTPMHLYGQDLLKSLSGQYTKVIAPQSPSFDGGPLFRQSTIDSLLRASAQFSIRRLKNRSDEQGVRPRRIALFYVPARDDGRLLDAFDFFVFPVPLRNLAEYDDSGKQKRHLRNEVEAAIRTAFELYRDELIGFVLPRIESRKSSEPLLLPPVNFHLRGGRLREVFRELIHRARRWENPLPEGISADSFDHERLPGFLRHEERQSIFKDVRGIVFPCARSRELHGLPENVDAQSEIPELLQLLRSVYRFGAPVPDGLHHDAQLEWGKPLERVSFECSRRGTVFVGGSHASVYPNDYVRVSES